MEMGSVDFNYILNSGNGHVLNALKRLQKARESNAFAAIKKNVHICKDWKNS